MKNNRWSKLARISEQFETIYYFLILPLIGFIYDLFNEAPLFIICKWLSIIVIIIATFEIFVFLFDKANKKRLFLATSINLSAIGFLIVTLFRQYNDLIIITAISLMIIGYYLIIKFLNKEQTGNKKVSFDKHKITITSLFSGNHIVSILWTDLKNARITEKEVILYLEDNEVYIKNNAYGYYYFIKNFPEGYSKFKYKYVINLFNQLQNCKICGFKSINNNNGCLNCYNDRWTPGMVIGEQTYLKEKQLSYFNDLEQGNLKQNKDTFIKFTSWKQLR